ncbi:TRDC protein, partial [Hemiprocne comata]|nr:TRDC protein [Hemiprocne comata]
LKSKEPKQYDSKLNMACLARTFYPKNISLDTPQSDTVYDLKAPIVTSEGIYSTMKVVGVESDGEVTCKAMHNGKRTTANTILPGTVEEREVVIISRPHCLSSCLFKAYVKMEEVNMLSMAVLGLRVLLAKSIAFNAIMSIKLYVF